MKAHVHVGEGYLVQATLTGVAVERGLPAMLPPFSAITRPDLLRQLFAGAIYAAGQQLSRIGKPYIAETPTSLPRYVYRLLGAYQTTHATPPTMTALAEHFDACGRPEVAERCRIVAAEESGHDTLALNDLRALGLPAEALVAHIRPRGAMAMVALFTRYRDTDPIACFGYAYALERMALFLGEPQLRQMESLFPPGIKASRCIRVHSAVGADIHHVRESLEFMATLPAADQVRIAQAVFETVSLMCDQDFDDFPGDEALMAEITAVSARLCETGTVH